MKTLVGTYTSLATAHKVVDELITAGFSPSDVGIVAHDPKGEYATYIDDDGVMRQTPANDLREHRTHDATPGDDAAAGAGIGATIGGIGGLLVGLGALAIPGVGPVIAAGPLLAALTGAGIGAVTGGLIGAMVDMGIPDEDANLYAEGVRRGHVLVTAQVPDTSVDKATQIMTRHDMLDIHREADTWRQGGWSGFTPVTNPANETVQHNRTRL
jgi:hypothetical protein